MHGLPVVGCHVDERVATIRVDRPGPATATRWRKSGERALGDLRVKYRGTGSQN
jgi:hypothetical protein